MGFQAGQIGRVGDKSATSGDDRLLPLTQVLDHLLFQLAKRGRSLLLENILNGSAALGFNEIVGIYKLELQRLGRQAVEGRRFDPRIAVGPQESAVQSIDNQADCVHEPITTGNRPKK